MMNDENGERQPLINSNALDGCRPPVYSSHEFAVDQVSRHEEVVVHSVAADELPPPYTPTGYGSIPMINCKVCQAMINLQGRMSQHVVKCGSCNEATAIRPAPAGKKYVRCKCNCLLICKASSQRISCPRENCKRVILLRTLGTEISSVTSSEAMRITCAYCHEMFFLAASQNVLTRCPHCRKVSAVRRSFVRNRGLLFFVPGVLLLVAGVLVIVLTQSKSVSNGGVYAAYVIILVASLILLLRSFYYCSLKISHVDSAVV